MNASNWGDIQLLWLLAVVPVLVVAFAFDGQRRRRALERIGKLPMMRRMTSSWSPARRRWRAVLTVAGVGLLVVALAQPQMQGKPRLSDMRGLDLVVALDFSKSMLARDIYPSRIDRAKAELNRLIDTLNGDRLGLVAFAGETLSYPLTIDYEAAKLFWRDLTPDDMPVGGTDLGRAIGASVDLLKNARQAEIAQRPNAKRRPAQVMLLLTDGEDTEGRGVAAAKEAAKAGIKIFTLGIGSNERPFVQTFDADGKPTGMISDETGKPVRVGLDEPALRQIAALTGGDYLALDPHHFGVDRLEQDLGSLERTQEASRLDYEPIDIARFFLIPAFLFLLGGAFVRERRSRAKIAREAAPPSSPAGSQSGSSARAAAALLLLAFFPFVTGFDLFLRRDPNIEKGNQALTAGKADQALKAYDRAAQARPDDPTVRFDRGAALYALKRYPEAQKEFQRAAEAHDSKLRADAYYNMGNADYQQKRFKDALEAYKRALGLRPDDRRAKWNLELALKQIEQQKQQQKQKQQQQQSQKDQKKQDQNQQNPQNQQDQKQQQADQQQQKDQQQKQDQQEQQQDQKQQQAQADQKDQKDQKSEKPKAASAKKEPARDIDKQDAEAVLDALERVEPTVQKDLARRRAGDRRPAKDW